MGFSALQLPFFFTGGCCNVPCASNVLFGFKVPPFVASRKHNTKSLLCFSPPSIACPYRFRRPQYRKCPKQQLLIVRAASSPEAEEDKERDSFDRGAPPKGKKRGSAVSGSKKIGRRKKSEHTETEAAEGASDGGKTRRRRKSEEKEVNVTGSKGDMQRENTLENEDEDLQLEENDDECNGNNYENNWPPLVCCFGAAQNKFVPISARHMTPEVYMTSEGLHWNPAEFVRARGGPPSNVAIALAQLGGRVAFMGKVGNDAYGRQMVITFNMNNVQTRGIRIDSSSSTSVSYMKLTYHIGKLGMSDIKPCAEDSLLISEINVDLLKEVRMFHFNSMVLLTKSMRSTLHAAIKFSRKCGGIVFFDVNLPLPLWRSRDETWRLIQKSWNLSNVIEVSKQELEFLLGEDYREKRRKMSLQYSAHSDREMKPQQHYCYTREELFSLWHDDIKLLIVNDGANLYYYTTTFEGSVPGAEAVVTTPFICDRSATNDAFVADLLRMLVMEPELYSHQVNLEKAIRYATTSGIAAQWDIKNCVRQYAPDSIEYKMKKD